MQKLTVRQQKFCEEYLKDGNASRAYREAYSASKMSDNAIGVESHRVLHSPNVSLYLAGVREKVSKKAEITLETITNMLLQDREFAQESKNASAAVSATMGLAKVTGHIVEDRKNNRRPLDDVDDAELKTLIERAAKDAGIGVTLQ